MKIIYDSKLKRPACVLLQSALGGTVPTFRFHTLFNSEDWLLGPTENMYAYEVTEEQLVRLSEITKSRPR